MTPARWLQERLPPIEPITLRGEADYYGASYEIARQLGHSKPPRSFASWRHGWVYQPIAHARQLVPWGEPGGRYLVATEAHVAALRAQGFPNAVAVGLPFLYAEPGPIEREPGSLLVMPSHSLPYTEHEWDEARYVAEITRLKSHFHTIVACIHSACVAKGLWVREFEAQGIPWVTGAQVEDRHALRRMATLFRSVEAVTSNAMGSHLAYAAYSGCRVSIFGPFAALKSEDYVNDPFYRQYPDLLQHVIAHSQEASVRARYPELFAAPWQAPGRVEWGAAQLGAGHQRPATEIAELLGWQLPAQLRGHGQRVVGALRRRLGGG